MSTKTVVHLANVLIHTVHVDLPEQAQSSHDIAVTISVAFVALHEANRYFNTRRQELKRAFEDRPDRMRFQGASAVLASLVAGRRDPPPKNQSPLRGLSSSSPG